jgi:hypothetical protein
VADTASFTPILVYLEKAVIHAIDSTIGAVNITEPTADAFVSIPLRDPFQPISRTERLPPVFFKQ